MLLIFKIIQLQKKGILFVYIKNKRKTRYFAFLKTIEISEYAGK